MIRSSLMKSIFEVLNTHPYLTLEDFKITEYTNNKTEPCLSIVYRYNTIWQFRFHIPNLKKKIQDGSWERYWFNWTINPGHEAAEETLSAEERQGLLREISEWLARLYEDIVSAPVVRQFEAHASALSELKERLDKVPDEPLTQEDVSNFRESLDALKSEFSQQLQEATSDKEKLNEKIKELSRDIDFLKQSLDTMTKRQWGEMLIVRMRKWKERFSLRQIATGARVLKLLLPTGVSDELDSVVDIAENIADVIDENQ